MMQGISSPNSLAPLAEAMASANVDPDQARKDEVEQVDFYDWFKGQNTLIEKRQSPEWRAFYNRNLRHVLYYEGFQTPVPRANGFGYDVYQLKDAASRHRIITINRLRDYSDEQTALWVSINPKINLVILDQNQQSLQRRIDAFESLKDHFNYRNHTMKFLQMCAKAGQMCGPYYAEVWYDTDGRTGQEYNRNYQDVNQPGKMVGTCMQCGEYVEFPLQALDAGQPVSCPRCQSNWLDLREVPAAQTQILQPGEWKHAGEVELRFDETWHHRWSITVGPDLSPWRYHERDEVKEVIEAQYGKLQGTFESKEWGDDEMMHPGRIIRRAERQRGTSSDFLSEEECRLIQRFYYQPEMLHFKSLKAPVTLPSGFQVPAGIRLSEVFPDGLCIKTSPGLPYFLDAYPENHRKRFINGSYGLTPGKYVAHGNDEAPDYNKYFNLLTSGFFDHTLKTMQPSVLVVEEAIPDGNIWNREDRIIKVNKSQLTNLNEGLKSTFLPMPPPPLSPAVQDGIQFFGAELQRAQKADSYESSGDKDVNPSTATASRIGEARMIRGNSLHLALFAEFLKDVTLLELKLAQDHYGEMRVVTASDSATDRRIAQVIRKVDIDCEIAAYVEEGSYMPDLKLEKQAAYAKGMEALQLGIKGGLDKQQLIRSINQQFGIDIAADKNQVRIRRCEETLEGIQEAIAQGIQDPIQLYQMKPVDPMEIGHEAMMVWWREWLSSPEGQRADPLIRAVATTYIQANAAAFMQDRLFMQEAASYGMGLIAPPQSAGMQAGQQQMPPRGSGAAMVGAQGQPQGDPGQMQTQQQQAERGAAQPQDQTAPGVNTGLSNPSATVDANPIGELAPTAQ